MLYYSQKRLKNNGFGTSLLAIDKPRFLPVIFANYVSYLLTGHRVIGAEQSAAVTAHDLHETMSGCTPAPDPAGQRAILRLPQNLTALRFDDAGNGG